MRILICCAESKVNKRYTSNDSLIAAFKALGHEVTTCGPLFDNFDGELLGTARDIRVYDRREHPETYTYDEILAEYDGLPDLVLQIDPHFYLKGKKPDGVISAYYVVDVHRGASVFREMAVQGNFDFVFLAHKYFAPLFKNVGIDTYWLPRAYDDECIMEYPEIDVECDISFIGHTGFSEKINRFPIFDVEIGVPYHMGPYPPASPQDKYQGWNDHNTEYNERAEILYRLSQDFDIRIYEDNKNSRGPNYAKMFNRGKITVNHSLWKDSALRNFEVLASNRFLIADMLPFQDELLMDDVHYKAYDQYFVPYLQNFDLEYEHIKKLVEYYLEHEDERKEIARRGCEFVKKYHTFKCRANTIINTIKGKENGYVAPYIAN